jgi:hypothetical protein
VKALAPVRQRLEQESAAMTPDFGAIAELINSLPMYNRDLAQDKAELRNMQEDYLSGGYRDPMSMFSKEGTDFLRRVSRFKNDETRQIKSKLYAEGLKEWDRAGEKEMEGDVHIQNGVIQMMKGANGVVRPARIFESWQSYNQTGARPKSNFSVNQGELAEATTAYMNFLAKAKSDGTTYFKETTELLTKYKQTGNARQIQLIKQSLLGGGLGQEHLDAFLAEAVRLTWQPGMSVGETRAAGNQRMALILEGLAQGQTSSDLDETRKENPTTVMSLSLKKSEMDNAGYSTWAQLVPNNPIIMEKGGRKYNSVGLSVPGSQFITMHGDSKALTNDGTKAQSHRIKEMPLLQINDFWKNFFIPANANPDDPLDLSDRVNAPQALKDLIWDQGLVIQNKAMHRFTAYQDSEGKLVTDGPTLQWGRDLEVASQNGTYEEVHNRILADARDKYGINLVHMQSVPVFVAVNDHLVGGPDTEMEALMTQMKAVEIKKNSAQGAALMRQYEQWGKDPERIGGSDEFYMFNLMAPVTNNRTNNAWADMQSNGMATSPKSSIYKSPENTPVSQPFYTGFDPNAPTENDL